MLRLRARLAIAAALAALPAALPAQDLTRIERDQATTMLREVRERIQRRYYDSTYGGVNLAERYDTALARVQAARSLAAAFGAIAQFTLELRDSHTFFLPPAQTVRVEYGWTMAMVGDTCRVLEVKPGSDAEAQGVHPGDRVRLVGGYEPSRASLWLLDYLFRVLRPQAGLQVVLETPAGQRRELALAAQVVQRPKVMDLTGGNDGADLAQLIRDDERDARELASVTVEVGDSVLAWKLPTFNVGESLIRAAFHRARGRAALVVDLRGNGGGAERALQAFLGHLTPTDLTLGILHERKQQTPLVARAIRDDAFTGKVIVLVDSRSASASEVTARLLQLTSRGSVLGDRTMGAVMRGRGEQLTILAGGANAILYGVSVTVADLVMPDGGRLEGTGVTPDEFLLPTAADLATGRDPVLARALALAGAPIDPAQAAALFRR